MFRLEIGSTKVSGELMNYDIGSSESYFNFGRKLSINLSNLSPQAISTIKSLSLDKVKDAKFEIFPSKGGYAAAIEIGGGKSLSYDGKDKPKEGQTVILIGPMTVIGNISSFNPGTETTYIKLGDINGPACELHIGTPDPLMLSSMTTLGMNKLKNATIDFNLKTVNMK